MILICYICICENVVYYAIMEIRIGERFGKLTVVSKEEQRYRGFLPQLVVPFIIIGWLLNAIRAISLVLWLLLLLLSRCLPTAILML